MVINKKNLESKIYIAGHKGLIGSAIYEKFLKFGYKNLIVRGRSELDLTDTFQTKKFFNENIIDFLFLTGYTGEF